MMLLTIPEVCREIRISRPTLYRWIRAGVFPRPVEIDGARTVRFRRSDLARFIGDCDDRDPTQPNRSEHARAA